MNFLAWIVMGALAGWLADIVAGPDSGLGRGSNVVVGILGSLMGGWVVALFGSPNLTGFDLYGFLVASLSSIVFLGLVQAFQRPALR